MQKFLFEHPTKFFGSILISLTLMGIYFTQETQIQTLEHITLEFEKRIDPAVPDKPFLLILKWEFPAGSKLYNLDEKRRYIVGNSRWNNPEWILEDSTYGISPNQKIGMFALRYPTAELLNKTYTLVQDPSLWDLAIKQVK